MVSEQTGTWPRAGARAAAPAQRAEDMAAALAAAGHEVRMYARVSPGHTGAGHHLPPGVIVERIPGGPAWPRSESALLGHARRFGQRLARRWRDDEWTPELIHAHYWLGGVAAMAAQQTLPVPVALTFHEVASARARASGSKRPEAEQTRPDTRIELERELGTTVGLVITQSRAELNELARLGVPRQQMVLVPAGVDPGSFAPRGPLTPPRSGPHQVVVVGSAGGLDESKGFEDLIQALRQVPNAELTIVGGPEPDRLGQNPRVRQLRALAQRWHVAERVRFAGRVPRREMPAWYRRADLVVCASWYEPFGTAVLEAMASGIPVVATAVGGQRDTVVDGVTGVLVPPHQPTTLGRTIRGLLADPIRRMEYAAAGLDRARQCYAWDRVTPRLEAQYHLLANA